MTSTSYIYDVYCNSKSAKSRALARKIDEIIEKLSNENYKVCFIRYVSSSFRLGVFCSKTVGENVVVDTFKRSAIFLCFLTNDFARQEVCSLQITRANELGKKVIYAQLEPMEISSLTISHLILERSLVFEFYRERAQQAEEYAKLFECISRLLTKPKTRRTKNFDFFFSHEGHSKKLVLDAYERLTQKGYQIWVDRDQLYNQIGSDLHKQLAEGILDSKFFVCFLSKLYAESFNCQMEYKYALAKKKIALFIVLEKFNIPPAVEIFLSNTLRLDAYKDSTDTDALSDNCFQRLNESIARMKMESEVRVLNEESTAIMETSRSLVRAKENLKRDLEQKETTPSAKQRRLGEINETIENHNSEIDQHKSEISEFNQRLSTEEAMAEDTYNTHCQYNEINLRISIASEKLKGVLNDQSFFIKKLQELTQDLVELSSDQMKLLSEQYDLKETAVKRNLLAFTEMEKELLSSRIKAKEEERDRVNQTINILRGKHREIASEMDEIEASIKKYEAYVPKSSDLLEAVDKGYLDDMNYWLRKEGEEGSMTYKYEPSVLLHKAAEKGHRNIVEFLLKKKVPINAVNNEGKTALLFACEKGQKATAELLISNNADLEAKDQNGRNALFLACQLGFKYLVENLVNKGADMHTKDNEGNTLLMSASTSGFNEIFEYLINKGADINEKNSLGWTALMKASEKGHTYIVQFLLSLDAELNAQNNDGQTALHIAANNSHKHIIDCLLHQDIDLTIKDKSGQTALHNVTEKRMSVK